MTILLWIYSIVAALILAIGLWGLKNGVVKVASEVSDEAAVAFVALIWPIVAVLMLVDPTMWKWLPKDKDE